MVATCRNAGVKVYVDAVINHMTGQGHVVLRRRQRTRRTTTPTTRTANFHVKAGECPSSDGGIEDFNNLLQVFQCNLLGLEDLRTETDYVQTKLAGYLNKLIGYGVSGFRVDAAETHRPGGPDRDLTPDCTNTLDGQRPYWVLEVFGGGPGLLVSAGVHDGRLGVGPGRCQAAADAFKSYPADHVGSIATLRAYGEESGLTPSSKTLVFVQNHDTERNGDALNYKDGARNILANEFILAYGYGTPQVYAGFAFGADTNQSPPSDRRRTWSPNTDCSGANPTWICIDRDQGVANMVELAQLRRCRSDRELVGRPGEPDRLQPRQQGLDHDQQRPGGPDPLVHHRAAPRRVLRHHQQRQLQQRQLLGHQGDR